MNKGLTLVLVVLALSVFVTGCSKDSAAEAPQGAPAEEPAAPVTGDAQADTVVDAAVVEETDDVVLGELI